MSTVIANSRIAPGIYEMVVLAPKIASKAQPGQFVIVMADERGERIPLTIADFDRHNGAITLVVMAVGVSSQLVTQIEVGRSLYALTGPLGKPSEIANLGTVVLVAGGMGTAPVYPIARAYKHHGAKVIVIQGARSKQMLFWTERLAAVSDHHIITTDDGSAGRRGLVTDALGDLLRNAASGPIGRVYAIGPAIMMKCCADTTRPFGVPTIVSLNSIMIDGTGMCGGCRVEVGGKTLFTCADGPEFDGHEVNWEEFFIRQRTYAAEEKCLLQRSSIAPTQ